MNQEYFLDDPVFKLVAIQNLATELLKTTSKKSIFKVVLNLSTKSLKNTSK